MRVALEPGDLSLEIDQGETILAAARRQGFDAPNSCRNGNCHVCTAVLLKGRVSLPGDREAQAGDEIYTCVATPLEDCTVHWEGVLAPGQLPVRTLACQVAECSPIGGDVWRVRLRTPASHCAITPASICYWSAKALNRRPSPSPRPRVRSA